MNMRRVNRSKKVPNVKLRPAPSSFRPDIRTPDSAWASSGLDSDEDTSHTDLCPRPFKGVVLCATGINDKTSLFKLALELGAQSISDLTDKVTHLIAEDSGSAKYRCALENRIPIMHPSWIIESHKIWLRGDDVDVAQSVKSHRLPVFSGVVLCVSGIEDVNKRMEIHREVAKAGGTYVKHLERPVRVTHLLCANTSEEETEKVRYAQKFNNLGEARIHIVWEDWFWDSLRFGGRFDEEAYIVSNPRPPPRPLPEVSTPPPQSASIPEPSGLSSEIQNAQTSAARPDAPTAPAEEEDEIASVKRVPAVTLHLWESILKPRGFEVHDGRLVRSPSKSQAPTQPRPREVSPSRAAASKHLSRRGTLKIGDVDDRPGALSALSSFRRARSFMPSAKDASTPVGPGGIRQPFHRTEIASRTSSFLLRSAGSVLAVGTSAVAGPSRDASAAPDLDDALANVTGSSDAAKVLFKSLRFRALGEARCTSVKNAIEECGGKWMGVDDDDIVDIYIVRLVSGSTIFRQERDEEERAKYRTECWLERCMFEERVCAPEEHITFTPLRVEAPIPGSDEMVISCSGLDSAEVCWVKRVLRALGISSAPGFSRRTTHLLCSSGVGAKADKAREWGTPIVDMTWLAEIVNTGQVPPVPNVSEIDGDGGQVLNLQAVFESRDPDEWMESQQPAPLPNAKGDSKGKERLKNATIIDIVDAENADAHSNEVQSLSYHDPPPDVLRPGQASQLEIEDFGVPAMLLGEQPQATLQPAEPHLDDLLIQTQPTEEHGGHDRVSIPSQVHKDRVPSSESPSPMRMPGASVPSTPQKVAKQATTIVQSRIASLLGKRASEEDRDTAHPPKLQAQDSRLGKRAKPLQRTRSNMSNVSYTELLTPPGKEALAKSPVTAGLAAISPVLRLTTEVEQDLLPQIVAPGASPASTNKGKAKASPSQSSVAHADAGADVDENSFVVAEGDGSMHVAYEDPRQNGELDRLKYLFRPELEGQTQRESWEMAVDSEMTLPQLPDVVLPAVTGRKPRGGGRVQRVRGRKSARA